jgi:hypothetical protein
MPADGLLPPLSRDDFGLSRIIAPGCNLHDYARLKKGKGQDKIIGADQ